MFLLKSWMPATRAHHTIVSATRLEEDAVAYYLGLLAGEDSWSVLPARFRTVRHRALVFQLVTMALGRIHSRFTVPHRNYPYRTFGLLTGAVTAEELGREPPCRFDAWTKSLMTRYAGNYDDPSLVLEVHVAAMLAPIDTAAIEARHASIRRSVMARVQTHSLRVRRSSAAFVLRGVSNPRLAVGKVKKFVARRKPDEKAEPAAKRRKGGGGPWRTYMREASGGSEGGLPDVKKIAEEYKAISPEEKARLVAEGKKGAQAHRDGVQWGPAGRRDRLRAQKRQQSLFCEQLCVQKHSGWRRGMRIQKKWLSRCVALRHSCHVSSSLQWLAT